MIKNAATIAMLYFTMFFCGGIAISVYEGLPLLDCLYEAASAVGTVGLTLGITPGLHVYTYVSGTCGRSDFDICGIFRKKQGECKTAHGEDYSWIEGER